MAQSSFSFVPVNLRPDQAHVSLSLKKRSDLRMSAFAARDGNLASSLRSVPQPGRDALPVSGRLSHMVAAQPFVSGTADHAHPALSQLLHDRVMRDRLADHGAPAMVDPRSRRANRNGLSDNGSLLRAAPNNPAPLRGALISNPSIRRRLCPRV